jgi:photosystem II stability/assembly factor-like uncharacterized protein
MGAGLVALNSFRPAPSGITPDPWARLGTQDVHALVFDDPDGSTVLFGHHGGILRSTDGGGHWAPLPVHQDAMAIAAAHDTSIIIAGHEVFQTSTDDGATWSPIDADLPSLDIHSFTRSRQDPSRMWANLAEGGLYESADGGHRWTKVNQGNITSLTATHADGMDVLLGVDVRGLVTSTDLGRTWSVVATPPTAPVISVATTGDGKIIVIGGPDGAYRSEDGGSTWRPVLSGGPFLAVATSGDGLTIAAVDGKTDFYRSDDGGATWPGPR